MTPLRRYQLVSAVLLAGCLALGSWVFVLKRQLYVANYYVDSGVMSVHRICYTARAMLNAGGDLTTDLRVHIRACLGVTLPVQQLDAISNELSRKDVPALLRRLDTMFDERRLPYLSIDPVGTRAPKQYVDGEPLPDWL